MKIIRILLLLASLFLVSCAAMHDPLQAQLRKEVKTIDVAQIEFDGMLKIRRVNPLHFLLGSSGSAVFDTGFLIANGAGYREKAGDVGQLSAKQFKQVLIRQLTRNGYHVRESGLRYWDYFKGRNSQLRKSSDGILRIRLEQVGFWSSSLMSPYSASILAFAEMIDPKTREVLYRERLSVGFSEKELKVMSAYIGEVNDIKRSANRPTYKNFRDLLANPEESSSDLIHVVEKAARHIGRGLRNPMAGTFVASEEKE